MARSRVLSDSINHTRLDSWEIGIVSPDPRLSGNTRTWFIAAVAGAVLALFTVGVWLAVEDREEG